MDHPPGRNVIRPELRSAHLPHHYQLASQQQPSASGSMGGIVGREFLMENPMFQTPAPFAPQSQGGSTGEPGDPPSPPSFADAGGKALGRKRSRKRPKTCGVCGDRAKSFHFGGLSCDSCKAFFRRSVQNDAHTAFRCAYDSCCDINISTRKSCQFCRFKKCLGIGMEKSWVMTEEERNALNQQRLEKKHTKPVVSSTATAPTPTQSVISEPTFAFQGTVAAPSPREPVALAFENSDYVAEVDKMLEYMTEEEQDQIKFVVETYLQAYQTMPFRVSLQEGRRDTLEIIEMFTTILRRFAFFSKQIPEFSQLSKSDQGNLLRAAVLEMCLLRGAACFDSENNRWPNSRMESLKDCPQLRVEDMQRLVSRELFDMHITFIFHMKRLRIDEPIAMLLIMTVLFSPERIPVQDKVKINIAQEKYLMLLKKYSNWKFGTAAGSRVYPQLLTKLSDLRQLNDFHTEFHLHLDRQEVNAIKKSMMELQLNPYPNWKIVPESQSSSPEESRAPSPGQHGFSLPSLSGSGLSAPMVTQALAQSFADRRIPALLENPHAVFETDLGMMAQVQQTLGSLFPGFSSTQSLFTPQSSSDTESSMISSNFEHVSGSEQSTTTTSVSPRTYPSSKETSEAQALELLQSSRLREYQAPSLTGISATPSHSQTPIMLHGEYHAGRLQQFLQRDQSSSSSQEASVIQGGISDISPFTAGGSQTVLRKHTSSSSLPGTPLSVIRSAHARPAEAATGTDAAADAQLFRAISCSTVSSAGWAGGEVHATANGHRQPGSQFIAVTTAARTQPSSYDDDPTLHRGQ